MEIIDEYNFFVVTNIKPFLYNNLNEPVFYKTTDAGETWIECKEFFKNSEKYSDVYCIDFYDKFNGIATFNSEILLKTTDGGDTWSREYIPYIFEAGTFNWAHSPYYPKGDFCFVTGAQNYTFIYKGEKTLLKPNFIEKINRLYQPTTGFNIEWEAVIEAFAYKLKIDTVKFDGEILKSEFDNPWMNLLVFDRNYFLSELENNTFYVFWLKAINENSESDWSKYDIATVDTHGYFTPEIIEPHYGERVNNSKVTIKWNKVVPVERYKLEIENSVNDDIISMIVTDSFYVMDNLVPSAYYLITLASYYGNNLWNDETSYFKTESVLSVENKENQITENKIDIYPNPVDESCNIIFNSIGFSTVIINIYNILGVLVLQREKKIVEGENIIQINSEYLTSGIYFVEIIESKVIKRELFIKQ